MRYVMGLALVFVGAIVSAKDTLPTGWLKAGSRPSDFIVAVTPKDSYKDHGTVMIRSIDNASKGFGSLMQTILADNYRARRVRFSGYLRTQNVSGRVALWMRVDGADGDLLGIDNMKGHSLHGNVSWKKSEIVMDIPDQAKQISFGALLSGSGQAWISDLKFEIVGKNVPVTSQTKNGVYPRKPINLSFK